MYDFEDYDDDRDFEYREFIIEPYQEKIDHAADWFKVVLDMVYGREEFNQEHLESAIEEIVHVLDLKDFYLDLLGQSEGKVCIQEKAND